MTDCWWHQPCIILLCSFEDPSWSTIFQASCEDRSCSYAFSERWDIVARRTRPIVTTLRLCLLFIDCLFHVDYANWHSDVFRGWQHAINLNIQVRHWVLYYIRKVYQSGAHSKKWTVETYTSDRNLNSKRKKKLCREFQHKSFVLYPRDRR